MLRDHEPDHELHKDLLAALEKEMVKEDAKGLAYMVSTRGRLMDAVVDAIVKYEAIHWPLKDADVKGFWLHGDA
jgi:hypothetical protein